MSTLVLRSKSLFSSASSTDSRANKTLLVLCVLTKKMLGIGFQSLVRDDKGHLPESIEVFVKGFRGKEYAERFKQYYESAQAGRSIHHKPPVMYVIDADYSQGVYILLANAGTSMVLCFGLLDKMRGEWKCNTKAMISQALIFASDKPSSLSGILKMEDEMKEISGVMKDSMLKVLERQERMEDIDSMSEELLHQSGGIVNGSRRIRDKHCWEACKCTVILIIVAIVIVVVLGGGGVLVWFLGLFAKIFSSSSSPPTNTTVM
jgi:hypothetical protein